MQTKLNPYIIFDNKAREALEFYKAALGGTLTLSTFAEGGMGEQYPNETEKIMHGQLTTDSGLIVMASDTPSDAPHNPGSSVAISLSGGNEEELRGYWDKLSEGGKVTQPYEKAPWGDMFGMFTDKFGIDWMVNASHQQ